MTEVADAESLIRARMPRWPTETVRLDECVGRVLAETIAAERDEPPFDRATMDGIAIAHADWASGTRRFRVLGVQAAGAPPLALARSGDCVRIMTGAACPPGADTIVPVERLEIEGTEATINAREVSARQFIHARGSDGRRGAALLAPGVRLGPAEIAVLAGGAGRAEALVARVPRIAAISTGDELVDPGGPVEPFQIRSSNDFAIEASLHRSGLATVTRTRLKDDPVSMLAAARSLHESHDALILSGGVSMGEFDFVPGVLKSLGAELIFHRIRQKPGRPMWFGVSGARKPIFALPGNPVSTLVCLTRYVAPALRYSAGLPDAAPERVRLTERVVGPADVTYFLPVKLSSSDEGVALAEPRPTNTSGDFVSLAGTDGFVELPAGTHEAGTVARLFRW
jgi:molybdopterin molybdotransferase